jgi:tetratricopeptide (TPR) repeat protein
MRAVFERSWGLLTPDEQQVLMRLAVFRGGFTREAAGFVARAGLPQLAGLIQKSLLRRNDERFELHELIRFYSGEHLRASASAAATRHRHLDYSLALAAEAYAEFNRSGDARWHHSLDVEIDNLRAALRYALESESYEAGARLCAALRYYWAIRGHFEEALDWIGRFLSRARLSESARGYLLATRVTVLHMIGDHGHALGAAEEAIALHRAAGDEEGLAIALNVGGLAAMDTREFARAREYFAETLALHRGFGNTHREGAILCNMGYVTCYQGDFASALAAFRSAYDLAVRYDDRLVIASGQLGMALVLTLREDVSGFHHVCAALPVLHSQRYTLLVGNCIVVLAAQAGLQGQAELAGLALSCYEQYRSANKLAETPGAHLVNQSLCAMAERMASAPAWVSGRQRGRTMSVSELLEQCCLV